MLILLFLQPLTLSLKADCDPTLASCTDPPTTPARPLVTSSLGFGTIDLLGISSQNFTIEPFPVPNIPAVNIKTLAPGKPVVFNGYASSQVSSSNDEDSGEYDYTPVTTTPPPYKTVVADFSQVKHFDYNNLALMKYAPSFRSVTELDAGGPFLQQMRRLVR